MYQAANYNSALTLFGQGCICVWSHSVNNLELKLLFHIPRLHPVRIARVLLDLLWAFPPYTINQEFQQKPRNNITREPDPRLVGKLL